ncbi:MAG: Gfo/Idh/MocA family oxidoreductase [Candidatus Omnitrophica bacterium]|nr:Gfo/Idh/MocA family oxidoreductase [Candidatus Omnitrophota bacterium]
MLNIGVIGFGYWGPNIVRNFLAIKDIKLKAICDVNAAALNRAAALYPYIQTFQDPQDILNSSEIDAVAIITPVSTHFSLAQQALKKGKHIFVEKPFTETTVQAQKLIDLAEKQNLMIMVDHTFIFTGAVQKIKELIDKNALGPLHYYDSTRISLGLFQRDTNVVWDLAPHDFSIIDYLIENKPLALTAQGQDHVGRGHENIAYITLYYSNSLIVHINVNWLSPVKVRTTLIGGAKKMLVWDDLETDEKIKVYDRGIKVKNKESVYNLRVDYRSGDMWSPHIDPGEALKKELAYFVECVRQKKTPINDGQAGLRVVKMLELVETSMKNRGKLIKCV